MVALLFGAALAGCGGGAPPGSPATPVLVMPQRPAATPDLKPSEPSEWTLLFYIDADNDLEASELDDLREMLEVGSSPQVQMVALVDRSALGREAEGHSDDPVANQKNWSTAKLFHIEKDKLELLEDWGEVNMGEGETLSRFLERARQLYPGQRNALFLLNHGEAWAGLCVDDSTNHPQALLSPAQLAQAIGEKPLPLLVLDCCLMSNLEAVLALQGRAEWLVASEEIIPLSGLNYRDALAQLQAHPQESPVELGQSLVDTYLSGLHEPDNRDLTHLALIRLGAVQELRSAVEELAGQLETRLKAAGNWSKLARARARSEEYGRSETPLEVSAEVHDLAHLSERVQEAFPDLAGLCRRLRQALKQCIRHQVRGPDRPHARGLSIFFPPQRESMAELAPAPYLELYSELLPTWCKLLDRYTQLERDKVPRPDLAAVTASADHWKEGDEEVVFRSRLARPQEVDTSYFLLVRGDAIVGQLPNYPAGDSTLLEDSFSGRWLALTQGDESLLCPLSDSRDGPTGEENALVAAVPAQLQRVGQSTWTEVTLYLDVDLSSEEMHGHLTSLVRHSPRGPVPIQMRAHDRLRLLHGSLLPGGHPTPGPAMTVEKPDGLRLRLTTVPPGEYRCGFQVTDLHGQRVTQTVPLRVDAQSFTPSPTP